MKDLFTYLCSFSVMTSIAILLAVILRPVLKKGPSFIRCLLWALVFLRLLIPVGFAEIPFSSPFLFENAEESAKIPTVWVKPAEDTALDNNTVQDTVSSGSTPAAPAEKNEEAPQAEKSVNALTVASVIWAVGVALMLGYMLLSNLLLRYKVRGAIVYDSKVRIIDRDCSPFVFGVFRPVIYIPASASRSDWRYIIAHENSHIKRFDHVLKPLAFLVLSVYWFDPLVWLAYALLSKDIEYACDEKTVKNMESSDRRAYSMALVSVSQGKNIVFAPPLSFGKVNVKERVKGIMNKKTSVWAICLTVMICVLLLFIMACSPAITEDGSADSRIPNAALEISVDYADIAELDGSALLFDDADYFNSELIKIEVSKEVKSFKFIRVVYDRDMIPYASDTLFEADVLTPGTPFYAKTRINDGQSRRGISYEDEDGETVYCRIAYNSIGSEISDSSLIFNDISPDPGPKSYITIHAPNEYMYLIYKFEEELSAENLIRYLVEYGVLPKEAKLISFEIKDGVGCLDMNYECFQYSTLWHDTVGWPAVIDTFLENYKYKINSIKVTYEGETILHGPFAE